MVVGMGTVFGFLVLLVVMMNAMGALVPKWFPEEPESGAENPVGASIEQKRKMAVAAAVAWSRQSGR